jgi:hypothetical protein
MGEVQPATYRCPVCGLTPRMPLYPQEITEHARHTTIRPQENTLEDDNCKTAMYC